MSWGYASEFYENYKEDKARWKQENAERERKENERQRQITEKLQESMKTHPDFNRK